MLVYVLNMHGQPLMPCKPQKARKLLKGGKAKVVKKEPFTIQLLFGSSGYKQNITLGVDAGSKHIGLSASTEKQELFCVDVELRNDIVDLLTSRRQARRTRRNRLRYRKARFLNRVGSKNKGWLAPSIEHKIQTHLNMIQKVHALLPVTKIIVETASFDTQKLKNTDIQGKEYQEGEQLGFFNVREYVLFRDKHTCQLCKGKKKDGILNVHHIVFRSHGGTDAPSNLITLCNTCHSSDNHKEGKILYKWMIEKKKAGNFKDAAFMGIMRWAFFNKVKGLYDDVSMTFGYITKNTRIRNGLPKSHHIDAYCIANNMRAEFLGSCFFIKKVRRHNRQIHKAKILKGGKKKVNQAAYEVKGFRLFDKVEYDGKKAFIFGRRSSGYFDIRTLSGDKVSASVSFKKLKLISRRSGYLIEGRLVSREIPPLP